MTTTIFIKRTIVACHDCGLDWEFPTTVYCIHCNSGVRLVPANEVEVEPGQNQPRLPAPTDQEEAYEPDVWSKRAVYVGMAIGLILIVEALWPVLGLAGLFEAISLHESLKMIARGFLFLVGSFTILRGMVSLANWTSGFRFYRRFKL